jgi:hypothetical protein
LELVNQTLSGFSRFLALPVLLLLPACGGSDTRVAVTFSHTSIEFAATEGGADPPDRRVGMRAGNGLLYGYLNWTATSDQPWLTISPSSGTIRSSEWIEFSLQVNARVQVEGWVKATSTLGAPTARRLHTAVWTGDQMVVWGGSATPAAQFNDGARYDPVTDAWLGPTSLVSAPTARQFHSGVWTGTRLIVWGGWSSVTGYVDTGGLYIPDSWTGTTSVIGALPAREAHTAVWTGSRMILWGGYATGDYDTGALYDPVGDAWTGTTTTTGAPTSRQEHAAVWTGDRMIVWGGRHVGAPPFGGSLDTGGLYDPLTDSWTGSTSSAGAPTPRIQPSVVWNGREMILWGGYDQDAGNVYYADGKRYDPVSNTWIKSLPTAGAPSPRMRHRAVWTGTQMIVWGGEDGSGALNTGAIYQPPIPAVGTHRATVTITTLQGPPVRLPVSLVVSP